MRNTLPAYQCGITPFFRDFSVNQAQGHRGTCYTAIWNGFCRACGVEIFVFRLRQASLTRGHGIKSELIGGVAFVAALSCAASVASAASLTWMSFSSEFELDKTRTVHADTGVATEDFEDGAFNLGSDAPGSGDGFRPDDMRVGSSVAPVPVPASLPLLLADTGGLGWATRRR